MVADMSKWSVGSGLDGTALTENTVGGAHAADVHALGATDF